MMTTRIAVVGDGMLDVLRFGRVTRMSPEDPNCPVFQETRRRFELGGAANVAHWLAAQPGTQVTLFCHHCDDSWGQVFREICRNARIELRDYLWQAGEDKQTTVKERLIQTNDARRHLVRADQETECALTEDEFCRVTEDLIRSSFDLVVVADYQKSMFTGDWGQKLREQIGCADAENEGECPVPDPNAIYVVNSKRPDLWAPNNVDFLVCNQGELAQGWAQMSPEMVLWQVMAGLLVVTMGHEGLVGLRHTEHQLGMTSWQMPTLAQTIVDVTGAGDAFTAGLAFGALQNERKKSNVFTLQDDGVEAVLRTGLEWAARCCEQDGCGTPTVTHTIP